MPHGLGKRMSSVEVRDQNHLFRRYPSIDNRQKEIIDNGVFIHAPRTSRRKLSGRAISLQQQIE